MDQRRAATDVGGSNDTSNMRSKEQQYTPDTAAVREVYYAAPGVREWEADRAASFDRWIAAHDAEVLESVQPPTREQIRTAIDDAVQRLAHVLLPLNDHEVTGIVETTGDAVFALFQQSTPSAEATAEALRRLREAVEEISHTPIMYGGGDEVTMRMSELGARIKAARDAAELLPIPDADPVLTPGQRTVLIEAANAYDGPLERAGRHDARRQLGRAIERIMRREGE